MAPAGVTGTDPAQKTREMIWDHRGVREGLLFVCVVREERCNGRNRLERNHQWKLWAGKRSQMAIAVFCEKAVKNATLHNSPPKGDGTQAPLCFSRDKINFCVCGALKPNAITEIISLLEVDVHTSWWDTSFYFPLVYHMGRAHLQVHNSN